jgi:glycerate-2-kinase
MGGTRNVDKHPNQAGVDGAQGTTDQRAIAPARILNLTVSDVVGDPLDCITDPTVQDTSTVADALSALREWGLLDRIPPAVRDYQADCAGRGVTGPQ